MSLNETVVYKNLRIKNFPDLSHIYTSVPWRVFKIKVMSVSGVKLLVQSTVIKFLKLDCLKNVIAIASYKYLR
jgi:hypothetical protein